MYKFKYAFVAMRLPTATVNREESAKSAPNTTLLDIARAAHFIFILHNERFN